MAFAFDSQRLNRVLADAEGVALGATDLARQVTALIARLETDVSSVAVPALGTALPAGIDPVPMPQLPTSNTHADLLASVQTIGVAADAHRRRAEEIVIGFVGSPSLPDSTLPRRRVLVVDDSQANLDVVSLLLEGAGFDAVTARTGLDALIVSHYLRPALIVMDLAMPILTGIDATRLLKSSAVTQSINVIAYTGERSVLDGSSLPLFADVVQKPATADEILSSIRRFISDGSRR